MNHKLYAWSILEEQEEEQNIREKRNCFSVVFFSIALRQSYARKLKPERDGQGFVTVRSHNSNVHYFLTWRTRHTVKIYIPSHSRMEVSASH